MTAKGRVQVVTEIRVALARRAMSQKELAGALSVREHWLSDRMTGRIAFDTDTLEAVGEILGVPWHTLLPDDGPRPTAVPA